MCNDAKLLHKSGPPNLREFHTAMEMPQTGTARAWPADRIRRAIDLRVVMDQGQVSGAPRREEDEGDQVQAGQGVGHVVCPIIVNRPSAASLGPPRRERGGGRRVSILPFFHRSSRTLRLDHVGDQDDAVRRRRTGCGPAACVHRRGGVGQPRVQATRDGALWKPSRSISPLSS